MELSQLLVLHHDQMVAEAADVLTHTRLKHYSGQQAVINIQRVRQLINLTGECITTSTLVPMVEYARSLARERFNEGFPLQEVQAGFNVVEEIVWKYITTEMPPADYPQAFGLASTILGAGKEALAVEYVLLASESHMPSLDLSQLFKGTQGG